MAPVLHHDGTGPQVFGVALRVLQAQGWARGKAVVLALSQVRVFPSRARGDNQEAPLRYGTEALVLVDGELVAHHRRKKPRKLTPPHGCRMCMMATPKRKNGRDRWPVRDLRRMES